MNLVKDIILPAVVLLVLDSVYLNLSNNFFQNLVKQIQNSKLKFKVLGAVICYILLVFGLYYFILKNHKNIRKSVIDAFVLGIIIYGVFEATNYAIFDKWNLTALVMDTVWGGIVLSLTAYIVLKFIR